MVFPIRAFFPTCRAPNRAPIRAFFPGLPCTKSCSNSCFFSRFGVHQIVLQFVLFFPVCRAPNRAPTRAFFPGLPCTKSCSNSCFFFRFAVHQIFSRFAVHQIVLQFVLFFPVCRAPNRAPIRAFFPGLPCTKSCSNSCFFSRFAVHQFVLFLPVCRAPNRAPIRAFFPSLPCTKSCSNSCYFSHLGFLSRFEFCSCWAGVCFRKLMLAVSLVSHLKDCQSYFVSILPCTKWC